MTDITGTKSIYSIRVLKCLNRSCPKTYHRELPDIIIPYRRYDAESIEEVITKGNNVITAAADQSTIWRWRKWFELNKIYIVMALLSVSTVIGNNEMSSLAISNWTIEFIKEIVTRKVKWLNETVRVLVNSSKWIFNRSAFLTG